MKFQITSLFAAALLAGSAAAHSWLECVDTDVPNHDAAQADPRIDPYVLPPHTLPPLALYFHLSLFASIVIMRNVCLTDMLCFLVLIIARVILATRYIKVIGLQNPPCTCGISIVLGTLSPAALFRQVPTLPCTQ